MGVIKLVSSVMFFKAKLDGVLNKTHGCYRENIPCLVIIMNFGRDRTLGITVAWTERACGVDLLK